MAKEAGYKSILSLDGGGIRGLIPARILEELESRTEKPIHELFDLTAYAHGSGSINML